MGDPVQEFQTSELDSIINVIGLTPSDPLDTFAVFLVNCLQLVCWVFPEMWYQVFLWALFSSLFLHIIAGGIAFCMLRRHKTGRFAPIGMLLMGVVSPLTVGVITSAVIAGVYRASNFEMAPFYALVWGLGQTTLAAILSFTRILATL